MNNNGKRGARWMGLLLPFICGLMAGVTPAVAQRAIPSLTGRVVDEAGVLSTETEQTLTTLLESHEQSTSNQVVVLTISSLEGEVLEDYSLRVARTWAPGTADNNNGVLLLVAVGDRKMRIEVGYGLEGDLPDAIAKRIIDNDIRPYFREGDFDGGVSSGVRAILGAIEGSYTPEESSSNDLADAPLLFRLVFASLFIGIPMFGLFGSLLASGCARWFLVLFTLPFFFSAGMVIWAPYGGFIVPVLIYSWYVWMLHRIKDSPKWKKLREQVEKAKKTGKSVPVTIGGLTFHVGGSSSGSSGGGFSGGGGSFGGGGSSGSW